MTGLDQPWVPRWAAITAAILYFAITAFWLVNRWVVSRRAVRRHPANRPYDWRTDGDATFRQPTHVRRSAS